jgi:hypothetical protein
MTVNKIFKNRAQQVGKQYGRGRKHLFAYSMVEYDKDGWVDCDNFLPLDYDLVYMKLDNKILVGWRRDHKWDGLHYRNREMVYMWKRKDIDECL